MSHIIFPNKFQIVVAITLIASQALRANSIWEPWSSSKDGDWYLLKDSVEYSKGTSTVWMLFNFKSQQVSGEGIPYRSIRVQYEYDCSEFSERRLWVKGYSDQMGTGLEVILYYDAYRGHKTVYSPSYWKENYANFCKRKWEFWK